MLPLGPDMASLTVGSNKFPTRVYENPPDLVDWLASEMVKHDILPEIEAFDLSHIHQTALMHADGRLPKTPYVQFVMGVKNAMPADRDVFDYYVRTMGPPPAHLRVVCGRHRREPDHRQRMERPRRAGTRAPGWRTTCGLTETRSAPSNAALVERVVDICAPPRPARRDTRRGAGDARAAVGHTERDGVTPPRLAPKRIRII